MHTVDKQAARAINASMTYHIVHTGDTNKCMQQEYNTKYKRIHIDQEQQTMLGNEEQDDDTDLVNTLIAYQWVCDREANNPRLHVAVSDWYAKCMYIQESKWQ
jgi:hypothetical protein